MVDVILVEHGSRPLRKASKLSPKKGKYTSSKLSDALPDPVNSDIIATYKQEKVRLHEISEPREMHYTFALFCLPEIQQQYHVRAQQQSR